MKCKKMIMIHDLTDPNDNQGRSYKEVNENKQHKFKVGDDVMFKGSHAVVTDTYRDCDGTPLYRLKVIKHGIPEECIEHF